jgi:ATP-dependent Clp protease ATP-binding subunit ClpC
MSMVRRSFVTSRTHEVFAIAHDLADTLGHDELSPLHVMIALLREEKNVAAQLVCTRVPRSVIETELEAQLPPAGTARAGVTERAWSAADEQLIGQAANESREHGKVYIGCEHVLLAFLRDTSSVPAQVLARHGIDFNTVREDLDRVEALTARLARQAP